MSEKKTHILYTSARGNLSGGGQVSLFKLMQNIPQDKYQISLMVPEEGNLKVEAEKLGANVHVWDFPSLNPLKIFSVFNTIKKLRKFLIENKIDIVHTDAPRSTFYLGRVCRKLNIPVIWHIRVSIISPWLDPILDWINEKLVTKLIVVSSGAKARFENSNKTVLIPNAIDTKEFENLPQRETFRNKFGIDKDDIVVGNIGKLYELKRQEDLIKATPSVKTKYSNVKVLIVGDGDPAYEKYLKKLAADLNVTENIIFTGRQENITEVLSSLNVFTLCSRSEGLPRVLIEAMAAGVPTVGSDIPGNTDVIINGDTGLLYPLYNVEKLSESIINGIEDSLNENLMGQAGRKRAFEHFSLTKNVSSTLNLYKDIIK